MVARAAPRTKLKNPRHSLMLSGYYDEDSLTNCVVDGNEEHELRLDSRGYSLANA